MCVRWGGTQQKSHYVCSHEESHLVCIYQYLLTTELVLLEQPSRRDSKNYQHLIWIVNESLFF